MKVTRRQATSLLALPIMFHVAEATTKSAKASVSNDAELRESVQAAMLEFIDATTVKGKHLIFDPVQGDYVRATFKTLHKNMALTADTFYVSCADFEDEAGNLLDVDFMVSSVDEYWAVFQSVIHMRDGKRRESHMEEAKVLFKRQGCCASKCCASKCCASKCCAGKCCAAKCCAAKCCASKSS